MLAVVIVVAVVADADRIWCRSHCCCSCCCCCWRMCCLLSLLLSDVFVVVAAVSCVYSCCSRCCCCCCCCPMYCLWSLLLDVSVVVVVAVVVAVVVRCAGCFCNAISNGSLRGRLPYTVCVFCAPRCLWAVSFICAIYFYLHQAVLKLSSKKAVRRVPVLILGPPCKCCGLLAPPSFPWDPLPFSCQLWLLCN